jgi:hypothetical protein
MQPGKGNESMSTINWKSEATYVAIGGGIVAILAGAGLLVGEEAGQAGQVIASLASGILGLVGLIGGIRARIKAGK